MTVLVTDETEQAALIVTRSLGQQGIESVAGPSWMNQFTLK